MHQLPFGNTGFSVSVVGFGAGHIGGPDQDEDEIGRLLNTVLDLGCTLLDTARGYGISEERIGRHVSHRRDHYILSSKCGYSVPGTPDWTGECVAKGIDLALETLRTDRLDIMHLHSCGRDILERGDVVQALEAAKAAGKVRAIAYSGEGDALAWALDSGRFDSIQCSINLCDQRNIDDAARPAHQRGLGLIAKRPLANAFWRHTERPQGQYVEPYWDRARAMGLEVPPGLDWDEYALRFAAFQPGVCSAIIGTKTLSHFERLVEAIERGPLSEDEVDATRRLFQLHDRDWVGQV